MPRGYLFAERGNMARKDAHQPEVRQNDPLPSDVLLRKAFSQVREIRQALDTLQAELHELRRALEFVAKKD
jgi:hypothetical protein